MLLIRLLISWTETISPSYVGIAEEYGIGKLTAPSTTKAKVHLEE